MLERNLYQAITQLSAGARGLSLFPTCANELIWRAVAAVVTGLVKGETSVVGTHRSAGNSASDKESHGFQCGLVNPSLPKDQHLSLLRRDCLLPPTYPHPTPPRFLWGVGHDAK